MITTSHRLVKVRLNAERSDTSLECVVYYTIKDFWIGINFEVELAI